jgi:hypothetical protein
LGFSASSTDFKRSFMVIHLSKNYSKILKFALFQHKAARGGEVQDYNMPQII